MIHGLWSLAVDKVVDKLCALVCWDNLINWLNKREFLDLNLPDIGIGLAPGHYFFNDLADMAFW